MLISCPNCGTKFAVPVAAIGTTGRKVKCTKCANVWFQEPIAQKLDNLLKVEYEPSAAPRLPARKKVKLKLIYPALAATLLFVSGSIEFFKHPEKYPFIAKEVGATNFEGLRFHDVKVKSQVVDKKMSFDIAGEVVNISNHKIKLPLVDIKIYSKGGRLMGENHFTIIEQYIEPFQKIDINPQIEGVSGNADKVELSFENWVESTLR